MIQIRPVDAQDKEVWRSLLELRERQPEGWTLIGARMVTLYAIEYGRTAPRFSLDADALINVRLIPLGTQRFSRLLLDLNYEMVDVSGFGHGHRFKRGGVLIDVLAPDGLNAGNGVSPYRPSTPSKCLAAVRRYSGQSSSKSRSAMLAACYRDRTFLRRSSSRRARSPSMTRKTANAWIRRSCSRSSRILANWLR